MIFILFLNGVFNGIKGQVDEVVKSEIFDVYCGHINV